MLGVEKLDGQFREVFILPPFFKKGIHLSVFVTRKISIYGFYELFSYSSSGGENLVVYIPINDLAFLLCQLSLLSLLRTTARI